MRFTGMSFTLRTMTPNGCQAMNNRKTIILIKNIVIFLSLLECLLLDFLSIRSTPKLRKKTIS